MRCRKCSREVPAESQFCPYCGDEIIAAVENESPPKNALRYKVVEQKQHSFVRGRMSAQDLEDLINTHAKLGWALDRIVAGETARFMGLGEKDVFLLIFRQEEGAP